MVEKRCEKCGFMTEGTKKRFGVPLCKICFSFAPDEEELFREYVNEKVDGAMLFPFRKYALSPGERQKKGMFRKAKGGDVVSRVPFGYKMEHGKLVPAQNFREVEEIFEEFLNTNLSLRQLAKKRGFSVNGLKKILTNFTYIGKVKFDKETHDGNHEPILSPTLFNHVQNKFERLGLKKAK